MNNSIYRILEKINVFKQLLRQRIIIKYPIYSINKVWKEMYGVAFPWDNPRDLNEKITWLMHKTDTSLWTQCADKFLLRTYLNEKGLSSYAPILYGCWGGVNEIDFDKLPNKFVIKCNHDCGSTIIVDKSRGINKNEIIKKLDERMHQPYGIDTIELHYSKINRKIIAEEYIENTDRALSKTIIDYKFWCFDGIPYYCFIGANRSLETFHADFNLYELPEWRERRDYLVDGDKENISIPKPHLLNEMIYICKKISEGFPQVRVDLYVSGDHIYVGEMTFTSAAGRMSYFTKQALLTMGELVKLPKV